MWSRIGSAPSSRDRGIDAFRYVAVAAVVILHALPTKMEDSQVVGLFPYLGIPARFAVPFFFITAGYFQRVDGVPPRTIIWRALRRLLPIYVAWILLYWLATQITPLADMEWRGSWRKLLQGGPLFHLWFLPALGFGLALVGVGRVKLGLSVTAGVAIILALIGLILTSYHAPLLGYDVAEPRRGVLFAPAFIVIGAWLSQTGVDLSARKAATVTFAGLAIIVAEEAALQHVMRWQSVRSHDISLGTFLYGTGAFLLARSWGGASRPDMLVRLGKLSLGVYIIHLYFIRALAPTIGNATPGQVLALATAALILATMVSLILSRVPGLRRLVS